MKYKYANGSSYEPTISISSVTNTLKRFKRGLFSWRYNSFVEQWCRTMQHIYDKEKDKTFVLPNKIWFHKGINLTDSNMKLHFDICMAHAMVKDVEAQTVSILNFSTESEINGAIEYSDESAELWKHTYENETEPVILVPFWFGKAKYLVIDGNHRVSAYRRCGKESIKVKVIDYSTAGKMLATDFERTVYYTSYEFTLKPSRRLYQASLLHDFEI